MRIYVVPCLKTDDAANLADAYYDWTAKARASTRSHLASVYYDLSARATASAITGLLDDGSPKSWRDFPKTEKKSRRFLSTTGKGRFRMTALFPPKRLGVRTRYPTRSQMVALPWPKPTQSVARAYL